MTLNAPSLWDGGIEWGDAITDGANGYWQASADPTDRTGAPVLSVAIAGSLYEANGATWTLGQSDWLAQLQPNGASITFPSAVFVTPNDPVVIGVMQDDADPAHHSKALWVGRVDSQTQTQDTGGQVTTTVPATDVIGVLGQAAAPSSFAGGKLDVQVPLLAAAAGVNLAVVTDDTLVDLAAASGITGSLLDLINRMARTSNAPLVLRGDGKLRAVVRQAMTSSVLVYDLSGADAPSSWTTTLGLQGIINDWAVGGVDNADIWDATIPDAASIALYGKRTYTDLDMLDTSGGIDAWTDILASHVLASPRSIVTAAVFPVSDLSQRVLFLDPLDLATRDDTVWQVMQITHDVSVGNQWTVTMSLDQTQSAILATPDPAPIDPSDPPATTTITKSYTSVKAGVGYRSPGGAYYGNGSDDYLSVGYYSGARARAFVSPPTIAWSTDFPGFIRVKNATLDLRTSSQVRVAFGSSPKVYARRITESWTEGTTSYPNDSNGGNLVWPGPSTTSSGQALRSITRSQDTDLSINITSIVQGWYDSGHAYGVRLASADEDASSRTTEFYSDDHAHGPVFTITCEVTI